jgi:DNA-binding GntR family transcriptional regulator
MPRQERNRSVRRYATTPDLIADALRDGIRRGELLPGQALRQEELAERFGVSRLPVRDALLRLEAEGLVAVYPNRGAFVVEFSADEVREIYDLRLLLEVDALRRAVPRMTEADLERVERACDAAERGAIGPAWGELDRAFHQALYAPTARARQIALIDGLRGTVDRYWWAYQELHTHTRDWVRDHRALVTACRRGDAETAGRLLEDHLRRAGELVVARLHETQLDST